MSSCDTVSNVEVLHWGIGSGQFEPPLEYISSPSSQGIFDQPCGESVLVNPLETSPNPSFASTSGENGTNREVHCMLDVVGLSYGSILEGGDGSFNPMGHTKDVPILGLVSTEAWAKETPSQSPQSNTATPHNLSDIHEETQNVPEKDSVEVKLRSASHKPKRLRWKTAVAPSVQQARNCHNNVEKQYRARLKKRFERLLTALQTSLPPHNGGAGIETGPLDASYLYSRGEVLDVATQRILTLQEENKRLKCRVQELSQAVNLI